MLPVIFRHFQNVCAEGELEKYAVVAKTAIVQSEGGKDDDSFDNEFDSRLRKVMQLKK
jgi:cytochrome c-type biogenesis protein CcmE